MKFVVSRFSQINGKWEPTQDIGSPYDDRADAELKLTQTLKAFEIFARYFHFDIREIPDAPVPEQPPLAKHCVVTEKFREALGHPFSLFVNYTCPICDQSHRIALDNIFEPGNRIIRCECGEKVTLGLQFEVAERPAPQMPQDQSKGPWLKFWNPKAAKH